MLSLMPEVAGVAKDERVSALMQGVGLLCAISQDDLMGTMKWLGKNHGAFGSKNLELIQCLYIKCCTFQITL